MEQPAINQRLNFLSEELADSVRAFSIAIDENTSNAHKYIKGSTRPSPEFLEKVVTRFRNINPYWLLTGEGEPFLSDQQSGTTQTGNFNQAGTKNKQVVKGNGNVVGTNHGNITHTTLPDCEKENAHLRTQIELLKGQLESKDALIAAKDEMLNFLRGGYNRPN